MTVTAIRSAQCESVDVFDQSSPEGLSDDQLTERVVGYASQIAALTARFLDLLREFDNRGVWSGEGIASCAHWLSWRTGLSLRAAQDHLRIAHALDELPQMHAAFAEGRLSYSKVRALMRVATPDREEELVSVALSATAAQVEKIVRSVRHIDRSEDESASGHIESSARWRWNDDGTLAVTMRLAPVDGARFLAGVVRSEYERTRTADDPDLALPDTAGITEGDVPRNATGTDLWRHVPSNIADAVVAMADSMATVVSMPEFAPVAEIVIHAETDDSSTGAHLDAGPAISEAEVDEASCGGSTRAVVGTRSGGRNVVLRWGRKRRLPTRTLLRLVFERDRGCRHPACGRTRHLHAHHVRFWRDGGTTDPDNLIMLCSTHHRALHHGEFSIRARGNQQFSFHRPDGSRIETAPPTRTPAAWQPAPAVAADAVQPVGGGRSIWATPSKSSMRPGNGAKDNMRRRSPPDRAPRSADLSRGQADDPAIRGVHPSVVVGDHRSSGAERLRVGIQRAERDRPQRTTALRVERREGLSVAAGDHIVVRREWRELLGRGGAPQPLSRVDVETGFALVGVAEVGDVFGHGSHGPEPVALRGEQIVAAPQPFPAAAVVGGVTHQHRAVGVVIASGVETLDGRDPRQCSHRRVRSP